MAFFVGTEKNFIQFIGPYSRNIVCNLARKHKKHTTCAHDGCNKRKPLEAAHIKGKERPVIIAEIIEVGRDKEKSDLFKVDLEQFKIKFIQAHDPIDETILLLCKQHHLEYDRKHDITAVYPTVVYQDDEDEDSQYSEKELEAFDESETKVMTEYLNDSIASQLKQDVSERLSINKNAICFAKISTNGLWNFDVRKSKFKDDLYFIFYDQGKESHRVAKIAANSIDVGLFPEKDADTLRFFVDGDYKDRSGFSFKGLL